MQHSSFTLHTRPVIEFIDDEDLNLDNNLRKLVVKAYNKAMGDPLLIKDLLGVSIRTVYRYRHQYDIYFDTNTMTYISRSQPIN